MPVGSGAAFRQVRASSTCCGPSWYRSTWAHPQAVEPFPLRKHRHRIAGEFCLVSDKVKASSRGLGDEAIERIAVKGRKRRKGEDDFQGNRLLHQSVHFGAADCEPHRLAAAHGGGRSGYGQPSPLTAYEAALRTVETAALPTVCEVAASAA